MSQLYRSIAALYLRQARKWRRLQSSTKRHLGGAHRGQSYVEMIFTVLGVSVVIITAIGLSCSLYMWSYMDDQVARGVIAPKRLGLFFFLFQREG